MQLAGVAPKVAEGEAGLAGTLSAEYTTTPRKAFIVFPFNTFQTPNFNRRWF